MTAAQAFIAFAVRLVTGARPVIEVAGESSGATVMDLPKQAVYYANHSSHLDFVTIWALLPGELRRRTRPVAAADYWGSGARGRIADRLFHPLLVERGLRTPTEPDAERPRVRQVDRLLAALDAGESLILFPEGTRGDGECIADFHAGLAHIAAARPDVPIVPVALADVGRILPKGSVVPVPLLVTVTFLPSLARGADEPAGDFLARARTVLVEALSDGEGTP